TRSDMVLSPTPRSKGEMKLILPIIVSSLLALPATAADALPVEIATGISVEAAWLRPIPGDTMSEVFLVVNNTTESPVSLSGVRYAGNKSGMLVSSSGEPLQSITIPVHAELYMTEGGVRVLIEGRF